MLANAQMTVKIQMAAYVQLAHDLRTGVWLYSDDMQQHV